MGMRMLKKTERENQLRQVASLYLRGRLQSDIAKELGISQQTVSYDLKIIHKRWRESTLIDVHEAKIMELAKIDALEQTYWLAWERSTKRTSGNHSYLAGVQWCIEQRCKIYGIYEAAKITVDWRDSLESQGYDTATLFEELIGTFSKAIENGDDTESPDE